MKIRLIITIVIIVSLVFLSLEGCASRVVYVRKAPPPTGRADVRPARPFANAAWIDGHWKWNGNKYVWTKGKWVKPRKGKNWIPGHWQNSRHGYRWIPGHWK